MPFPLMLRQESIVLHVEAQGFDLEDVSSSRRAAAVATDRTTNANRLNV
jgi:hypothetical protein